MKIHSLQQGLWDRLREPPTEDDKSTYKDTPKPTMLTAGFITAMLTALSCCAATAGNLGLEMASGGTGYQSSADLFSADVRVIAVAPKTHMLYTHYKKPDTTTCSGKCT